MYIFLYLSFRNAWRYCTFWKQKHTFFFCKLGFFFPLKSVDEYARNVCMNACKNNPILKQIILALFYKLSFSFSGFSKKVTQKTGAKLGLISGIYYPFFTHPPYLESHSLVAHYFSGTVERTCVCALKL